MRRFLLKDMKHINNSDKRDRARQAVRATVDVDRNELDDVAKRAMHRLCIVRNFARLELEKRIAKDIAYFFGQPA